MEAYTNLYTRRKAYKIGDSYLYVRISNQEFYLDALIRTYLFFLFVISVTVFVCTILKKFFVSDPAVSKLNQSHKDVLLTVFFFTIISSCLHVTQLDQFRFGNRSALNRSHDNGNLALKTCILKHREIHSIGTSPSPLARQ